LSQTVGVRIILHLMRFRCTDNDHIFPKGTTQGGIAEALDITSNHAGNELRKLETGGYVEGESKLIAGMNRKLNRYLLTPAGRSLGWHLGQGSNDQPRPADGNADRAADAPTDKDVVRMLSEQMGLPVRTEPEPPRQGVEGLDDPD